MKIVETALQVLNDEIDGINLLKKFFDSNFEDAVKTIFDSNGKVVVSGVGKSGHVGRKISATLSSTGTPSFFIHPTEASHGDLGMITRDDFCLLISNSGETSELNDILTHAKRFGIPTAVISSSKNSSLMQAADFKLALPNAPEACAIRMAPTTSTMLTMALGDALAVSLMEKRDFKPEDFRILHPGGNLGSQMLTASQLMRDKSEMAIVKHDFTMSTIVSYMSDTGLGVAVLVDKKGKLTGIITDGDLRRNINNLLNSSPIDVATLSPITVQPNDLVSVALEKMEKHKIYAVIVIEEDQPIGLLRMHDILRSGIKLSLIHI